MATTTKRSLNKPERTSFVNVVTAINNNMDNLDDAVPDSRKVNGKALSSDVTIDGADLPILNTAIVNTQAMIAPPFVEATPNEAGTFVTNAGKLYYLPNGHTANATWANTSKTEVKAGSELTKLKSAIDAEARNDSAITGNTPLVFQHDLYYRFTGQGANVSLTPTVPGTTKVCCAKCACVPGDKFTVKVTGGGGVQLAYGFCDANGVVKEHAAVNTVLDGVVLTAPSGSEYVVFNNVLTSEANYYAIKGTPLLKDAVSSLNEAVDSIGGISASDYSNLLANIDINCRVNLTVNTSFTDTPPIKSGVFINNHVNATFNIQYFITHAKGIIYNRIVRRSNHEVYRDWVAQGFPEADPVSLLNVLVLGDSICRGGRNNSKGFIGDVGCQYVNMGVGGATISNKTDSSSVTDAVHPVGAANIPDQLVKYATECTGEDWYIEPDVIIAEGGVNDMSKADIGTIPTIPAHNDTEAAALPVDTLCGGLEYLFYQMIKLYPLAKRFFLVTNRLNTRPWTPNTGETTGYTQTEMVNAIKAVCAVYSVKVIDVFNESPLDSYFSQYNSPTAYSEDHSVTDLYCIDKDKLHPLALGYKVGYAPLVKGALQSAIKFN